MKWIFSACWIYNPLVHRRYLGSKAEVPGSWAEINRLWGPRTQTKTDILRWYAIKITERQLFPWPGRFSLHWRSRNRRCPHVKPCPSQQCIDAHPFSSPRHFIPLPCSIFFYLTYPCPRMTHFNYLLSIPRNPHPVVGWSLLILVCKSRLLNIQEFCKLVVKLAIVGVFTPWKLTNATNWGLLFLGGVGLQAHNCPPANASSVREESLCDSLLCPQ